MNRMLHFNQNNDLKVYVTTDTHLNHDPKWPVPLWKSRGFNSSLEHTNSIIDEINKKVRDTDVLIHLGDFFLNTPENQAVELLSKIKCQNIYMIWGNHNNPLWKIYKKEIELFLNKNNINIDTESNGSNIEIYPFRYRNLIFVGNYLEFTVDKQLFIGFHYPISIFNKMEKKSIHLCGHSHYNFEESRITNLNTKILDVCWEGHKTILSIDEIVNIMKNKGIKPKDHHIES